MKTKNCKALVPSIVLCLAGILAAAPCTTQAANVPVSNGSFESEVPGNPFLPITEHITSWSKLPNVFMIPEMGFTWNQTSGNFIGVAPFSPQPYGNLDGTQAAYLLSLPGAGIFQDNQSADLRGNVGGLDVKYEAGVAYTLTLGLFGKQLTESFSSIELSLYYRDGMNAVVPIGGTEVTFSSATFNPAGPFNLIDYSVEVITRGGDAWAGKNIGIQIANKNATGAGYWDLDNVRLTTRRVPDAGSTLALLGIGVAAVAGAGSRRRARA